MTARFFNSLAKYRGHEGLCRKVEVPAGAKVGDLIDMFRLPPSEIYLVLLNGRDITPAVYQSGAVNREVPLDDGDIVAFSGPAPYSFGYGAPLI